MKLLRKALLSVAICVLALSLGPSTLFAAKSDNADTKNISKAQIDQLVAPIALYPDALLAQVLMASTYPLEIVQAARWISANSRLKGKALEKAAKDQSWDPSVKSIALVPQVLQMMNDKLDWVQQLGDAFLAQQEDVMAAVQGLRKKADDAGNLKATKEQKVTTRTVKSREVIVITSTSPEVIYVPVYDPVVIYGRWPYPASPPYYWYPPGYVARSAFWFGAGVAAGAALWGNVNWGNNKVNINVNHYNNFNRTNIKNANWRHNANHRKGVPYRDRAVRERYGRGKGNTRSRHSSEDAQRLDKRTCFAPNPRIVQVSRRAERRQSEMLGRSAAALRHAHNRANAIRKDLPAGGRVLLMA